MKKKIIAAVILIVSVCVCLFSGYKIFVIKREYSAAENMYFQQEKAVVNENEKGEKAFDFEKLKTTNKDICGWIEIPAIKVSYPVLQGENNNSYLRRLPDGTYNVGGSIFVDERCRNDFTSPVTVIYGHFMYNGSMFGRLKSFLNKDFLNNNRELKIYTPDKTIYLQILACFEVNKKSAIYNLPENEITDEYIETLSQASDTELNEIDKENEKIVLLSTCSHSFESARTVLAAKYKCR